VEPTGIEPVTSCLQSMQGNRTRGPESPMITGDSGPSAVLPDPPYSGRLGVDSGGFWPTVGHCKRSAREARVRASWPATGRMSRSITGSPFRAARISGNGQRRRQRQPEGHVPARCPFRLADIRAIRLYPPLHPGLGLGVISCREGNESRLSRFSRKGAARALGVALLLVVSMKKGWLSSSDL
jgi:hypothetical protein